MKSITLKMFLSYWVIMMGVNIASDFVAPEQMRRYSLIREAIRSAMLILGQQELDAYETHGCGEGMQVAERYVPILEFLDLTRWRPRCVAARACWHADSTAFR
jgi:hypothetical protein